jgi:LysR family transcriptional regulator, benzoate and cis,cis-muconate-responsive activator of ben and cat genes
MELRQLRYFTALATELNFTRAARLLHVSQPPLSLQIAQLEEELGARLFDRTSRSVSLTPCGKALLPHAQAILARAEEARGHVMRISSGLEGRVRVGMSGAHFAGPFPRFVAEFRQQKPKVDVQLVEMTPEDHIHGLRDRKLDLCLSRSPRPDTSVGGALLWRDPVVVAVPNGHRLGRRARIDLTDLRNEDFVMVRCDAFPFAQRLRQACLDEGFEPRVVQEVADFASALNMTAAGIGVALAPASMALKHQDALTVCTLVQSQISLDPSQIETSTQEEGNAKLSGDIHAIWRADDDSAALSEFRKSLVLWAREQVQET